METCRTHTDRTAGAGVIEDPAERSALAVSGEIDLASVLSFTALLQRHLDRARPGERLDVDLSRVVFFSAAGLRALLAAGAAARRSGCELRVAALSPAVDHVLGLTGTRDAVLRGVPPSPRGVATPGRRMP
jgi:anti-anti-sigma factor